MKRREFLLGASAVAASAAVAPVAVASATSSAADCQRTLGFFDAAPDEYIQFTSTTASSEDILKAMDDMFREMNEHGRKSSPLWTSYG